MKVKNEEMKVKNEEMKVKNEGKKLVTLKGKKEKKSLHGLVLNLALRVVSLLHQL